MSFNETCSSLVTVIKTWTNMDPVTEIINDSALNKIKMNKTNE